MKRSKFLRKGFAGLLALALIVGTLSQVGMTAVAASTGEETASEQSVTEQSENIDQSSTDSDQPAVKSEETETSSTEKTVEESETATSEESQPEVEEKGTEETKETNEVAGNQDGKSESTEEQQTDPSTESNTQEESENDASLNEMPIVGSDIANGVTVSVNAPKGSFPEGTTLSITPISQSKAKSLVSGDDTSVAAGFDISFSFNGEKVQPEGGHTVEVTFSVADGSALSADQGANKLSLYHIGNTGAELLGETDAPEDGEEARISAQASNFSPFVIMAAAEPADASGTAQTVDATITDFRIEQPQGTPITEIDKNSAFYLAMDWKVADSSAVLHEGDYFEITLPDNMRFPSGYTAADFGLTDENGEVIAHGHVTPGSNDSIGGTVKITFNEKIEGKYNVHGTMYLYALFNKKVIQSDETNTFTVSVNGKTTSVNVKPLTIGLPTDEVLGKWGERIGETNQAQWYVRINYAKTDMKNAVITDSISGDETYVPGSFSLRKVEFNETGGVTKVIEEIDLTDKLTLSADNKSFTINIGDAGNSQYHLRYTTTFSAGTTVRNNVTLTTTTTHKQVTSSLTNHGSGGTAGGDLANKIKITKVDADDESVVLAGAVFEVTRPDGTTFELTTGADGAVTSDLLTQGTYKVKEKKAPTGYELNDEEFTLEVTSSGGALKTVTDKPTKTSVSVKKNWVGPEVDSVTVHLLAGGTDTGKTLTLTKASGWSGKFEDLRVYSENGEKIVYTVSEDPVSNYTSEITGDVENGFTITNTNSETTSVSGTKTWNDNNNQDGKRPDKITVNLLANGKIETSKEVTAADNWVYEFTNLPVYKDGQKVTYTVTEEAVENYSTEISGFDITNSYTPEQTSVTVTKSWNDSNNQDGKRPNAINVQLYADGEATGDAVTLDSNSSWTHTWSGLAMYKNGGTKIAYTVKETSDLPEGYTSSITGDAQTGYTITNSYTPETTSISGTKTWNDNNNQDGKRPDKITVQLYKTTKDGTSLVEKKVVTSENNWAYSFSNLPAYQGGEKIVYSISEEVVAEYTMSVDGYNLTNTHTPDKTSVSVTKSWDDGNNKDGIRPGNVVVHLLKNGKDTGKTAVLNATNNWKADFQELDIFENGDRISYSISEENVNGYTALISGDMKTGFYITNKHTPKETPSSHTPSNPRKVASPKTGDASNMGLWLGLMLASLVGLVIVFVSSRRNRNK